jgi:hypothetical protein
LTFGALRTPVTNESERALLSIAENGTATHVETTLRAYRRRTACRNSRIDRTATPASNLGGVS